MYRLTLLLILLLVGCVSPKSPAQLDEEYAKFRKGQARLTCLASCSMAAGFYGAKYQKLIMNQEWEALAKFTLKVGYSWDVGYFYLGRAAEGMGLDSAARVYYQIALTEPSGTYTPKKDTPAATCAGPFMAEQNCFGTIPAKSARAGLERIKEKATTPTAATSVSTTRPRVKADKTGPQIVVPSVVSTSSESVVVAGMVNDAHRVTELRVEGKSIESAGDGSFSFSRYVPAGGSSVRIEAIDEWGNRSEKTIQLNRDVVDSTVSKFSPLNPTRFSGRSNGDAVALVIGIADYKRAGSAQYADRDAKFFSDYAKSKLGVPKRNIKILLNENADTNDIIEAMKVWLPAATQANRSDIYVFFAGHGLGSEDGKEVYLLPYSGIPSLLDQTALVRAELFESLEAVSPRSVTVFLDTCYSGTSREETLVASRPLMLVADEQAIPAGFTVFSATSMKQTAKALPEAQHGLFSYYLMKGMEGEADADGNKEITAGELHTYVLDEATHLRRNQTPQFQGDPDRVLVRW